MFFKNTFRPAMAGASAAADTKWSRKLSSMMFSNGTAESADFGAFSDEPERPVAPKRNGNGGKKGGFKLDTKAIVIVAVAAVLVIALIIVGLVALFMSGAINFSGNIMYEDNAYMVYVDGQDNYRIIANGELLEETFDGELTLIPADDNSFAYVFHDGEDGIYMYILKGKKLEAVVGHAVEEVLATAGLKPGIVFAESDSTGTYYVLYNGGIGGTSDITDDKYDPKDFIISDDGQTVVFTEADDVTNERLPYIFDKYSPQLLTPHVCTPVAISNHGDYIYVTYTNSNTKTELKVIDKKGRVQTVAYSDGFEEITDMNVKGDEIIFRTANTSSSDDKNTPATISYFFKYNKNVEKSIGYKIGPNIVRSVKIDPEVAIYKTFKDKHLETSSPDVTDAETLNVYYINNSYELSTISNYSGKFDPDGDYFYCIDNDGGLIQYDSKDQTKHNVIAQGVADFEVTEKGNVYFISRGLKIYKKATQTTPQVSRNATEISYYSGSNKLYFTAEDATTVLVSEESNSYEVAKFGSTELKSIPYFSTQVDGRCYAIIYDEDTDSYAVYYSSNGNKFKLIKGVSDCKSVVYGVTIPEDSEW